MQNQLLVGSNLDTVTGVSIILFPFKNSPLPNESEEAIKPIKEKFITGEICVSGETVTDGYDYMPGATRDARFTFNGKEYHRMGDLGYWDKDKNLRFMGRKAECVLTESGLKLKGVNLFLMKLKALEDVHSSELAMTK